MPWNPSLNSLQLVLADLYPTEEDARRVVDQAGLEPAYVDFGSPAINVWHSILSEALRQEKVDALIGVAREEYPDNQELAHAIAEYRPAEGVAPGPEPATPSGFRPAPSFVWLVPVAAIGALAVIFWLVTRGGSSGGLAHVTPTLQVASVATATPVQPASATPQPAAETPTPFPTPVFASRWLYDLPSWTEQVEYRYEPGILPAATITDFLRLSRVELGDLTEAGASHPGFNIRLSIKNVGPGPLVLDLDHRFFGLEDAQGRPGELVYFCCAALGEILLPGQEREIQVVFRSYPGWFSKERGVSNVLFTIDGLRPVLRAAWRLMLPVTGD
jgi:hypothetical protein